MHQLTYEKFCESQARWHQQIKAGAIVILPTDTIYGFSGNALMDDVIEKVMAIKERSAPFSLVPHDLAWAKHLVAPSCGDRFLATCSQFSGPYTMLWPCDPESCTKFGLHKQLWSTGFLGFRLPAHWITSLAASIGYPLITTSVNRSGNPPMTSLDDLEAGIAEAVDLLVYEGPKLAAPSTIVHCADEQPRFITRAAQNPLK